MSLRPEHMAELKRAKRLLENPGLAAKITNLLGAPIEKSLALIPNAARGKIMALTQHALAHASKVALWSLQSHEQKQSSDRWHKLAVATTGGVGGFFGMATLAVELPISTTIMLRSIVDIARSEGEDLSDPACKLACLEVFAMGGRSAADDGLNSSYFAVRAALAKSVAEAAQYTLSKGVSEAGAPILVRLISQVAQRLGVQITEKVAAQAIPVVGAAGGAAINALFISHFQDMARGHFIVRRLERIYGEALVRSCYAALP